jgi:hypothetical protein
MAGPQMGRFLPDRFLRAVAENSFAAGAHFRES